MFSSQKLIYALIFLLIACGSQKVIICESSDGKCLKYKEVLDSVGLESEMKDLESTISLSVSEKNKRDALKIISYLVKLKDETSVEKNQNLKSIFIPQKILSKRDSNLKSLNRVNGIFDISCEQTNGETIEENCQIFYLSTIVNEEKLREELNAKNLLKKIKVDLKDLSEDLGRLLSASGYVSLTKEKMIVLSPFSFHVPFIEKEIAGVQLILVLGLFLLSGFILGFWVANRNFAKGKF